MPLYTEFKRNNPVQNNDQEKKIGDIPCLWIGRLNIIKLSVLPNLISRFNAIPIKIPANIFVDIDKQILTFICRGKRSRRDNTVLKEKKKVRVLSPPIFKTYYKAILIQTV